MVSLSVLQSIPLFVASALCAQIIRLNESYNCDSSMNKIQAPEIIYLVCLKR